MAEHQEHYQHWQAVVTGNQTAENIASARDIFEQSLAEHTGDDFAEFDETSHRPDESPIERIAGALERLVPSVDAIAQSLMPQTPEMVSMAEMLLSLQTACAKLAADMQKVTGKSTFDSKIIRDVVKSLVEMSGVQES